MQLKVGNYAFAPDSCDIRTFKETLWNKGGQPYAEKCRIEVTGYLGDQGDGQAQLTQKSNALLTALSQPFPDIIFYQSDGAESATKLKNAGSISGVRVIKGVDFPEGRGAEYATFRTFAFAAEAEYPLNGTAGILLSFSEEVSFEGGKHPIITFKKAINGPPQKQIIYPRDSFRATQSGEAVGYRSYPTVPAPIWPKDLIRDPQIRRRSPDRMGKGYQGYFVSWRYDFESVNPLVGSPNLWE